MPERSSKPLVYACIISYNGKKWLDTCLRSLLNTDYPNFRVLIVDNASSDGSIEEVRFRFPVVEVITNDKNLGTAAAKNIACRYALRKNAEYICILNQDMKMDKDWVTELVSVGEKNPAIGLIVPLQYDYSENGELEKLFGDVFADKQKKCFFQHTSDYLETDHYIGAAVAMKRIFVENIGLYDPFYFMYHEENDLCRRGLYRGFKTVFALRSKVYHHHHYADKRKLNPTLVRLYRRSYFIFKLKNIENNLTANLAGYYREIFSAKIKLHGKFKGSLSAMKNLAKESTMLLYIPIIIGKRFKEKRYPCYLSGAKHA